MAVIIRNGAVFDGTGAPRRDVDVLVGPEGRIEALGRGLEVPDGATAIDATGCWVTPGFIDLHTHYDAELEVASGAIRVASATA